MTKPVWSHVLASSAWNLRASSYQQITNICMQGNSSPIVQYSRVITSSDLEHTTTQPIMPKMRLVPLNVCLTNRRRLNQLS